MYTFIEYMEDPIIYIQYTFTSISIKGNTIITFSKFNNEYTDTHPTHLEAQRNGPGTDDSPSKNPPSP